VVSPEIETVIIIIEGTVYRQVARERWSRLRLKLIPSLTSHPNFYSGKGAVVSPEIETTFKAAASTGDMRGKGAVVSPEIET